MRALSWSPPVSEAAPRWLRAYLVATCAVIGAGFAYAACDWGHWPKLLYFPLHARWSFAPAPGITMLYHGMILWGLGGFACGALVGALLGRFVKTWSARNLQLFGAWAITSIVLGGTYYTWNLWPW
ncbi:MAG: hypothetical protein NT062_38100 [Proteobacteria bacterium]|nr:hypothetical protein [Pseudomonadota bacterium]